MFEADAVVPHEVDGLSGAFRHSEFDPRGGVRAGALPGVVEKILQGDTQQARVASDNDVRLDDQLDAALRCVPLQLADDLVHQATEVHRLYRELAQRRS